MSEHEQHQVATMAQVKRIIRKKLKHHPEHEHNGLNIYPMMDMMTILLVFMVMQFSSSTAAAITQSSELTIPYSTSVTDLGDAPSVQISRSAIVVDGEQVCDLRSGVVDPSQKQGGGTGVLITPLARVMREVKRKKEMIAAANPNRPFEGEVQIIADQHTPFRTIVEVVYTLGQSGFSQHRFVSNKTETLGGGD